VLLIELDFYICIIPQTIGIIPQERKKGSYLRVPEKGKFEDTKGVTRDRSSKKGRHYNDPKKTVKRKNRNLQNTMQKTKD
jgi:hypothetical protein